MSAFFLCLFRFARLLLSGHQAVAIENAALRLQIAAFQRRRKRPALTAFDRVFWITLRSLWPGWRGPLKYVQPDTVARWHRDRFRRFWARLSRPHGRRRGRPSCSASSSPSAPCSRILRGFRPRPSQTWKTFLHNHVGQMVSIDFFTVPTITMKVLFVFVVLEHRRRQVLHFNITEHPTAAWTSQQIVEAFADREGARYLLRDRDSIYGREVRLRIQSLGTKEVLTAPQKPWQNPYAERLIGSIRRECLNHFVILNAFHLRQTLLLTSVITMNRERTWAWGSNVPSRARWRRLEGLSPSLNSAAFIIAMTVLHDRTLPPDGLLANECVQRRLAVQWETVPPG